MNLHVSIQRKLTLLSLITFLGLASSVTHAVIIGNSQGSADFPQGAVSFADAVVNYAPLAGSLPDVPYRGASNALGVPNYAANPSCASQAACTFVSLGSGGSITLQFIDNRLTGSGNNAFDLWIFEVGPDIEDTFVEISKDGVNWTAVGKVFGSTAGIDIDAFGFGTTDLFSHVRLTDDPNEGASGQGGSVGADIDAVGAISTVRVPVPGSALLLLAGLVPLVALRRWSNTAQRC